MYKNDSIICLKQLEAQIMAILKLPLIIGQGKTLKEGFRGNVAY